MPPHHAPLLRVRGSALTALILACLAALAAVSPALAQSATGVVTGRVFNPATGEYLRNASVRLRETDQSVTAGDGGVYRFDGVAPGVVTVEVNYTGYRPAEAVVQVAAGATVEQNFELVSSLAQAADPNAPLKLEKFVVVADIREGNAKAIMDQRSSMNITNTVATDIFGDVAEGNVGEFLKHLPGVSLNLVEGEIRNVSLRGLGAEYTSVTLDGMSLAGADANTGAAGNARAFAFEQVSLSSIESVEVSKTISADVDASAPAGTINLRTKRAFDREGRRVVLQANVTAFGDELSLARSVGPDDHRARKLRGGGSIEYSDVFLDKRLGVVLNINESNLYTENNRSNLSYNTVTAGTDTRPVVPTALTFVRIPHTNRRATITLASDYKLTPDLVLSLSFISSDFEIWSYIRQITFNAGTRAAVTGDNPLLSFSSTTAGRVTPTTLGISKHGKGTTVTPKFEYKRDDLTVEGRFSVSDSVSEYLPHSRGVLFEPGSLTANGVAFTATRSSPLSADWQVQQVAGPDIASGASYLPGSLQTDDGRYGKINLLAGDVTASLKSVVGGIPVTWKTGVKKTRDTRDFEVTRESYLYNYTGPGAGLGAFGSYVSPYDYDLGSLGATIRGTSGGRAYFPATQAMYELFRSRPEYFTPTLTATNYYNAYIANKKHYVEDVDAAFLMATATLPKKVTFRAGLRWEKTSGDSLEFNPRSAADVVAAGYTVAGGRATTVEGIKYQFQSRPRVHRTGSYDNLFPSASLKYQPWRNLDLQLGYSSTIRRPTFRDVAGVWTINDEALTVSAPNPNLKPEESDNYSFRAAYYFEPVGIFAVNLFQNNVRGLHRTTTLTAQEYGYTGEQDLSAYLFSTTVSSANEVTIRGMEFEYSQSLSFLPGALRGFNVRASYTRNYADVVMTNMAGHSVSGGLGYSLGRFSVYANAIWQSDRPINITNTAYDRHRSNVDVGGSVQLSSHLSLFVNARNIFNDPYRTMNVFPNGQVAVQNYQVFGTNYTVGLKAVF